MSVVGVRIKVMFSAVKVIDEIRDRLTGKTPAVADDDCDKSDDGDSDDPMAALDDVLDDPPAQAKPNKPKQRNNNWVKSMPIDMKMPAKPACVGCTEHATRAISVHVC